ncbi:transcriptional regulator, BadM/Rrf2 family protein [Paenibacillus vortex V453]|jgi:Rrf2 family protein|uniref:Rrf2 family transcriptional regulator n=2 Tax=Paenibacillus TaxID=44249 RepID=A0A163DIS1_9BACL|nr:MULTISPECIES: Rrf2 family transcriptional regulator [Paenibacillus]MCA4752298.1 Rrf2 family transcriptional regulator [Mycolicibacterium fortuitum]AVV58319.1 Rrf2 family transcriptional regulator [Paenibacillus glucanolyticus]AWP27481.1 transcriptional regulator [Paenibacillus sp. Cedars]EFU40762.1 transcriptional regulator, BadM/Rrf2 family protein [Paenibacillus vortex V453]ETT42533.1 BadM/Rrf2 family transcriptional regulator [Paenibacillus sp. FSL R5-808]
MQFSKSTDYALHALIHLGLSERNNNIGIKELSATLGVSETYLSKIMSKLRQDGIVRAVPGVNGGYELAKSPEQITFLDVIQVIEGRQHLFECSNTSSRQHEVLAEVEDDQGDSIRPRKNGCLVEKVMLGAEQHMHQYLREYTIQYVLDEASKHCNHAQNKK